VQDSDMVEVSRRSGGPQTEKKPPEGGFLIEPRPGRTRSVFHQNE
jgi:hypothetical protein